jgi:hypothetical protein
MKQYVTLQVFKTFPKVRYYTFQIEGHDRNETDKFFSKLEFVEAITDDLYRLNRIIITIGERTGAIIDLFRPEDEAVALPPKPSFRLKQILQIRELEHNNLRLYCIWISEKIVILANGGVKTSQKTEDSPDLMPHFRFIKSMGKQINRLIIENSFTFEGKEIVDLENIDLTF